MLCCAPACPAANLVFACLICWKLRKNKKSFLGILDSSLELTHGCAWEREEQSEPEFRKQRLVLLLGCPRREKSCCDLSGFESHPGSLPAPGRASALLTPTDTELEKAALPSSGVCFTHCQ